MSLKQIDMFRSRGKNVTDWREHSVRFYELTVIRNANERVVRGTPASHMALSDWSVFLHFKMQTNN